MTKEDKQQYCRDYYYKTKDKFPSRGNLLTVSHLNPQYDRSLNPSCLFPGFTGKPPRSARKRSGDRMFLNRVVFVPPLPLLRSRAPRLPGIANDPGRNRNLSARNATKGFFLFESYTSPASSVPSSLSSFHIAGDCQQNPGDLQTEGQKGDRGPCLSDLVRGKALWMPFWPSALEIAGDC